MQDVSSPIGDLNALEVALRVAAAEDDWCAEGDFFQVASSCLCGPYRHCRSLHLSNYQL